MSLPWVSNSESSLQPLPPLVFPPPPEPQMTGVQLPAPAHSLPPPAQYSAYSSDSSFLLVKEVKVNKRQKRNKPTPVYRHIKIIIFRFSMWPLPSETLVSRQDRTSRDNLGMGLLGRKVTLKIFGALLYWTLLRILNAEGHNKLRS